MTTTIYKVTNTHSGDVMFTAYETESDPFDAFSVKQIPLSEVPAWALDEVKAELKELGELV